MEKRPKKIAILGGGVGALTAAWYLTSKSDWQRDYEITVYQLGWRLGGKGATGRNAQRNQRIQEHGLHVWFGWYENAFRTLRDVYGAVDAPRGSRSPRLRRLLRRVPTCACWSRTKVTGYRGISISR